MDRRAELVAEGDAELHLAARFGRRKLREPLARLDQDAGLRSELLPFCRLRHGEIWEDPVAGHRVGVLDATESADVEQALACTSPLLCVADPPYNLGTRRLTSGALGRQGTANYDGFTRAWLDALLPSLAASSSLYAWLGADPAKGFHPVPEFLIEMRDRREWTARNWITMRNQRGYGTQRNWMWVRQELFYYVRGTPPFDVRADYTDIPKILRGYYKEVAGQLIDNTGRGRSPTIRAGNVWVDIQQVFYRRHENVPGCYAQKPLKAIERIVRSATRDGDCVLDPFCHSGTTLIACEMTGRRAITFDIDPIFAEIAIRRLERFRATGREGWQCENPFPELASRTDAVANAKSVK